MGYLRLFSLGPMRRMRGPRYTLDSQLIYLSCLLGAECLELCDVPLLVPALLIKRRRTDLVTIV